jgi:hypothetical protein
MGRQGAGGGRERIRVGRLRADGGRADGTIPAAFLESCRRRQRGSTRRRRIAKSSRNDGPSPVKSAGGISAYIPAGITVSRRFCAAAAPALGLIDGIAAL